MLNAAAPSSAEVYEWPEFRAFADRLGVPIDARTTSLTIHIGDGTQPIVIAHNFQGVDATKTDNSPS